jgi:hypothetical protein
MWRRWARLIPCRGFNHGTTKPFIIQYPDGPATLKDGVQDITSLSRLVSQLFTYDETDPNDKINGAM